MAYLKDIFHPEIRTALKQGLYSYTFWGLLGLGFGLSYCNSNAAFGDGFTLYMLTSWFFFSILSLIAVIDTQKLIVPDVLVFPLLVLGVFIAPSVTSALWGVFFLGGGFWLIRWGSSLFLKQEAMGLGDVKLAAASGAWVGIWGIVPLLLVASFSALFMLVMRRLLGKTHTPQPQTPFAPYLALGAWVAFTHGYGILKTLFTLRQTLLENF